MLIWQRPWTIRLQMRRRMRLHHWSSVIITYAWSNLNIPCSGCGWLWSLVGTKWFWFSFGFCHHPTRKTCYICPESRHTLTSDNGFSRSSDLNALKTGNEQNEIERSSVTYSCWSAACCWLCKYSLYLNSNAWPIVVITSSDSLSWHRRTWHARLFVLSLAT